MIMTEENVTRECRLKNIEEIRHYFIEEINQKKLMIKKFKKVCRVLNYIEYLLILVSTVTGCVSVSAFASLVGFPVSVTSYVVGLKTCVITARFKKHKSIIEKKKHDEIILLEKSELNNIEVLISKVLTDSNISHDGFVLVNNVLKEFEGTKKEIKNF